MGVLGSQVDLPSCLHEASSRNVAPSPGGSQSLGKRNRDPTATDTSSDAFADEARSVALDLGLLTLNSDSRQTHYLGTSSGRLFTRLIGAGSPDAAVGAGSDKSTGLSSIHRSTKFGSYAHTKRLKESCRLLYDTLRKSLPTEDDARLLLEVYLRNIHVDHPFLHPKSLFLAVEALYQCAAAETTTEIGHNGWAVSVQPFAYNGEYERSRNVDCTPITVFTATFHVFMVFALAATVRTRQRVYDFAPNQFYRVAMTADQHCFSNTSLASLQATLLLAVHSLLSPTELNIWTLTYVSMAHCVDLGLHRSISDERGLSHAAVLTRKLLFFSVYHLDRYVSVNIDTCERTDSGIGLLRQYKDDRSAFAMRHSTFNCQHWRTWRLTQQTSVIIFSPRLCHQSMVLSLPSIASNWTHSYQRSSFYFIICPLVSTPTFGQATNKHLKLSLARNLRRGSIC